MNYKQLQKLNEIIETLKAQPNSDENIQFVLDLADKSVNIETLENLIRNGNTTANPSNPQQDKQANFGLKFTNEEIRQMPKTFKKNSARKVVPRTSAKDLAGKTHLHTKSAIAEMVIT